MESPHSNWFYSRYHIWYKGTPQQGYSCCSAEAKLRLYGILSVYFYTGRKRYGHRAKQYGGNSWTDIDDQIKDHLDTVWEKLQRGEKFKLNRWVWIEKTRGVPLKYTKPELLTWEELQDE